MAAPPQVDMNPRYTCVPRREHRNAAVPTTWEKAAMETMVPAANAHKYSADSNRVWNASIGSTPRKCELPARPCSTPIPTAA